MDGGQTARTEQLHKRPHVPSKQNQIMGRKRANQPLCGRTRLNIRIRVAGMVEVEQVAVRKAINTAVVAMNNQREGLCIGFRIAFFKHGKLEGWSTPPDGGRLERFLLGDGGWLRLLWGERNRLPEALGDLQEVMGWEMSKKGA